MKEIVFLSLVVFHSMRYTIHVHGKEMFTLEYTVRFDWDADAAVWVATSEDIPGLVLESGSIDALIERVRFAVPELIELDQM